MKFGDINIANETVHIQRQITSNPVIPKGQSKIKEYKVEEKAPKTENSIRFLKLPSALMREISKRAEWVQRCITTTFEYYCDQMDENEKIISFMNSNFIPEEESC